MWVKWTIIGMCALGVISTILMIDKPRKPITAEQAVGTVIWNTLMIVGILLYWR